MIREECEYSSTCIMDEGKCMYCLNHSLFKEKKSVLKGKKNTDLVTGEHYHVKNVIVYGVKYTNYTDIFMKYNIDLY